MNSRYVRPRILIWVASVITLVILIGIWGIPSIRRLRSESLLNTAKQAQVTQAKVEGDQWLRRGVRLEKGESARVAFSPDGLWLVGGKGEAALWNSRSGENMGKFGELSNGRIYKSYVRVDFISNQEITWASRNNILTYNLKLGRNNQVLKQDSYRSFEAFAAPSLKGVWCYVPDLYDNVSSIGAPKGQRQSKARLRFLNLEAGRFTSELPLSLTYPASVLGRKVNVDVTLKYRKPWLAVKLHDSKIFVLDKNNKAVWQEGLGFLTDGGVRASKLPIIFDFEITATNRLLLLDRDSGLRQINLTTGKEAKPWPLPLAATSFAITNTGKLWAFGNKEGELILIDAVTRKTIKRAILPFPTEFLTFSPDEKFIAAGGITVLPIPLQLPLAN